MDRGKVYGELDVSSKPVEPKFSSFVPRIVVGAGGQFGFEQPVAKKFAVQADRFTGKYANGYFTPGFFYKLTPKLTGYVGYSLGNTNLSHGNHFVYAEVGFNFN